MKCSKCGSENIKSVDYGDGEITEKDGSITEYIDTEITCLDCGYRTWL